MVQWATCRSTQSSSILLAWLLESSLRSNLRSTAGEPLQDVTLSGGDAALFVSDIHLCDDEPEIAAYFLAKLQDWLQGHTHLFILGDLFESWCGDDCADSVAEALISMLKRHSTNGLSVYVMRGNRDFLINQPIAQTATLTEQMGALLLADECLLKAFDKNWALCHGDQLCTLDTAYQAFRMQSRSEPWQQQFLALAKTQRLAQARQMRAASRAHQAKSLSQEPHHNNVDIYDVSPTSVNDLMKNLSADYLLHGHTHKPAVHEGKRWVLSDWSVNPLRGDAISLSAAGVKRLH
jgi:UDP-2,3-diacylglucosamine hydrolase